MTAVERVGSPRLAQYLLARPTFPGPLSRRAAQSTTFWCIEPWHGPHSHTTSSGRL